MRRAVETAEAIARASGLAPRIEPDLHERKIGPLSGKTRDEAILTYGEAKSRWMAGEIDYTHEGGESYAQIRDRVVPVLRRVAEGSRGKTVVVVAHGVVIRVLLASLLDDHGPSAFERFAIDNVGINDLRWDGARWSAVALNDHAGREPDAIAW